MMISPETYYECNLKGKSANEIKSEIKELEKELARLKASLKRRNAYFKNMASVDFVEEEWLMCPSLETQISCTKQYLQEAIRALAELGEEYVPSKK